MALQRLCRACCCGGTREGSPDSDHDPALCPLLASFELSPAVSGHEQSDYSETDAGSIHPLLSSPPGSVAPRSFQATSSHGSVASGRIHSAERIRASQADCPPAASVNPARGRDVPLSDEEARVRGRQVIQWIENPSTNEPPCPVSMNTLTYQQLQDESGRYMTRVTDFMPGGKPGSLKFPAGVELPRFYIQRHVNFGHNAQYVLFFAEGIIGLYDIRHEMGSPCPHPTDVALTLYREEFEALDTLRYVYVYGVINGQTVDFLDRHFEACSLAQFGAPDKLQHCAFMHGTPEYEGLLGVRIPRTVGYLVLGAFPRGDRRIARMEAYPTAGFSYDIRFDIESIQ